LTFSSFGQVEKELADILLTKDYEKFKQFGDNLPADNYPQKGDRISSYWKYFRELTKGFNEGIYFLEHSVPDSPFSAISTVYTFRVNIITTDHQIVYYDLAEQKNRKVDYGWEPYYISTQTYSNDSLYAILEKEFKIAYDTTLNKGELFTDSIVFGHRCGRCGVDPIWEERIIKWVAENSKTELIAWLKSTNTEKQIYAIEGLYYLRKKGNSLTKKEYKIIRSIKKKKGTALCCNGCLYTTRSIWSLTKGFSF
jgi:hypothetical protein